MIGNVGPLSIYTVGQKTIPTSGTASTGLNKTDTMVVPCSYLSNLSKMTHVLDHSANVYVNMFNYCWVGVDERMTR